MQERVENNYTYMLKHKKMFLIFFQKHFVSATNVQACGAWKQSWATMCPRLPSRERTRYAWPEVHNFSKSSQQTASKGPHALASCLLQKRKRKQKDTTLFELFLSSAFSYWYFSQNNSQSSPQQIHCNPGGGGGTPIYGLYRYVPRDRVCFLRFSVLNRVSLLFLLALCSRCDP